MIFFLLSAFSFAQVEKDLNGKIDSIIYHCLKSGQLQPEQGVIFRKIIRERPKFLGELIDSAYYDFAVIREDYNISSKKSERSATFIAKGYEELYYNNGKIIRPLPDNKGIKDSISKLILQWPYKTIDSLDPPPIIFRQSRSTPSEIIKRKMKKAKEKEKRKGGTEGLVYRIIIVVNLVNGKRNIVLFIPRKKIREVIFVASDQ